MAPNVQNVKTRRALQDTAILVSWDSTAGADAYIIEQGNGRPQASVSHRSSFPSLAVTGISPAVSYYFRVGAIINGVSPGEADYSPWAESPAAFTGINLGGAAAVSLAITLGNGSNLLLVNPDPLLLSGDNIDLAIAVSSGDVLLVSPSPEILSGDSVDLSISIGNNSNIQFLLAEPLILAGGDDIEFGTPSASSSEDIILVDVHSLAPAPEIRFPSWFAPDADIELVPPGIVSLIGGEIRFGTLLIRNRSNIHAFGGIPDPPDNLRATVGDGRVTMFWSRSSNREITGYEYKIGLHGEWVRVPNSRWFTTSVLITGLTNGELILVYVRAVNDFGPGIYGRLSIRPRSAIVVNPTPDKPEILTAIPRDGSVSLLWNDADDDTIIRWEYQQRLLGDAFTSWKAIPDSDSLTNSHLILGLVNGDVYEFRVRSVNANGVSQASPVAQASPKGGWITIWGGRIEDVDYRDAPRSKGSESSNDTAVVRCLGMLSYLAQSEVQTGLLESERSVEAINQLMEASFVPEWARGTVTSNNILQFWWAADDNGLRSAHALETTENAAFNELSSGVIVFDGASERQARLQGEPEFEFSDDLTAQTAHIIDSDVIQRSRSLRNAVRVPVRQYETSAVVAVLWKWDDVIGIPPGESFDIVAGHDLDGVGQWITPVANTDYKAVSGSGADISSGVVTEHRVFANTVNLTFSNTNSETVFISGIQLRGKSVTPDASTYIPDEDETSIRNFGRRPITLTNSWVSDINVAEALATEILENLLNPVDKLSISFYAGLYPDIASSIEVDQVITAKRRGETVKYRCISISHMFGKKAARVEIELVPLLYQDGLSNVIILDVGPPLGTGRLGR